MTTIAELRAALLRTQQRLLALEARVEQLEQRKRQPVRRMPSRVVRQG